MGLIFLILALLSCNCYLIEITATDGSNSELNNEIENADLIGLIQFAKTNSEFSAVAVDLFRRKYGNYNIKIAYESNGEAVDKFRVHSDEEFIEVLDYELSLDTLKYFGSAMTKLEITKYWKANEVDASKIYRFINQYASRSLTNLRLGWLEDNVLAEFTEPFAEVDDLYCPIRVNETGLFIPFNQLFPKLQ